MNHLTPSRTPSDSIAGLVRWTCLCAVAMGLPMTAAVYQELGGQVVIEAEHFHDRTTNGNDHWHIVPDEDNKDFLNDRGQPAFLNPRGSYLQMLPDNGGNGNYDAAPFADYRMLINTPGTYRLYLRWVGWNGNSDSLYAQLLGFSDGIGGTVVDYYMYSSGSTTNFADRWMGTARAETQDINVGSNIPVVWQIPSPGLYTIRITQREDGCAVDTLLFQLDSLPAPGEPGPAESPVSGNYPPFVRSRVPASGSSGVYPDTGYVVQLQDGAITTVDQNGFTLTLDGTTPITIRSVSKTDNLTTVTGASTGVLAADSTHTVELVFKDNLGASFTNAWRFTVEAYPTLTPDMAVLPGEVDQTKSGFNVRMVQVNKVVNWPQVYLNPRSIETVENLLAGRTLELETGKPFTNIAYLTDPAVNPDGTYTTELINWNQEAGIGGNLTEAGNFRTANGFTDLPVPAIPGNDPTVPSPDVNLDNFAAEIVTYLELKPGLYRFGVNSDDGFRLIAGRQDPHDPHGLLLGEFNGSRSATDSLFSVGVAAAGIYPVRLVWFDGTGGASIEFFSVDLTTTNKILINDRANLQGTKSYASPALARPFASLSPAPNAVNVLASAVIQAQLFDRQTVTVNQGSIELMLNGTKVAPTFNRAGKILSVVYDPPGYLTAGSTNVVTLVYADTGSPSRVVTNTWQFVVQNWSAFPVIPASFAVPPSAIDLNSTGFLVDSYCMTASRGANNAAAAERQLARGYLDPATGQPYPNQFALGTEPDGRHPVHVINWNQTAPANAGNFGNTTAGLPPGVYFDALFPGQPAAGDSNNIVTEAIAYVELKKGLHQFGANSDDGFRLTTAANPKDLQFALQLGLRGTATDELFYFFVEEDGIYPLRLIYWEGTGGATLELFNVEPNNGARRLINDRTNTAYFAVKAYSTYTGTPRPYVLAATPAPNAVGEFPDATVQAVITNYTSTDVKLRVNGTEVTPTVTAGANSVTVRYTPTSLLAPGSTNTVAVEYASLTTTWSFTALTYVTLPPGLALPVSAADPNAVGFWSKIAKAPDSAGTLVNTIARAESLLAGALTNTATGQPYVNEVPAGPGPNGTYLVPGFVNWNLLTNQAGNFQAPTFADQALPGIAQLATNFNVAAEVVAWLELPAGLIKLGVNSDDGFRVTVATNADPAAIQVGAFDGTRGAADTRLSFITPTAGLYPLRLLYYQGSGNGSVELFSFDGAGNRVLVNDRAHANAVKAYWQVTGQAPAPDITEVNLTGGNVTIKWTGGGTLEWTAEFPTTGNPTWTSTGDSDGEFTESAGAEKRFYRVRR